MEKIAGNLARSFYTKFKFHHPSKKVKKIFTNLRENLNRSIINLRFVAKAKNDQAYF